MSMFDSVLNAATGGLAGTVFEAIKAYFPPSMTDEQKQNVSMQLQVIEAQRQKDAAAAANEAERNLNERIAQYEGTAGDLKTIPLLGPVLIMARGAQRPVWGFGTLICDFQVFSGSWVLPEGVVQNSFYVVNFLVLGFLFGERALQNILPLVTALLQAKQTR